MINTNIQPKSYTKLSKERGVLKIKTSFSISRKTPSAWHVCNRNHKRREGRKSKNLKNWWPENFKFDNHYKPTRAKHLKETQPWKYLETLTSYIVFKQTKTDEKTEILKSENSMSCTKESRRMWWILHQKWHKLEKNRATCIIY